MPRDDRVQLDDILEACKRIIAYTAGLYYMRNTWGSPAAGGLIERDGRRWFEVVTPRVLEKSPMFAGADPLLLHSMIRSLRSVSAEAGATIIRMGDMANETYLISRGQADVKDRAGKVVAVIGGLATATIGVGVCPNEPRSRSARRASPGARLHFCCFARSGVLSQSVREPESR